MDRFQSLRCLHSSTLKNYLLSALWNDPRAGSYRLIRQRRTTGNLCRGPGGRTRTAGDRSGRAHSWYFVNDAAMQPIRHSRRIGIHRVPKGRRGTLVTARLIAQMIREGAKDFYVRHKFKYFRAYRVRPKDRFGEVSALFDFVWADPAYTRDSFGWSCCILHACIGVAGRRPPTT